MLADVSERAGRVDRRSSPATATASTIPSARSRRRALQPPFEHPGRAEAIRAALAADDRVRARRAGGRGARRRSRRCTTPGWCASCRRRGRSTSATAGPTHDVVPDVFAMAGLRDGHGRPAPRSRRRSAARLGWWCFETTTPLTEGTYEAARSAVDVALSATRPGARRRAPSAYGLCRPPGHHATTLAVRRLLLLQQRRRRRPPRGRRHRRPRRRARRRLPPRQRHPADLLRARRRGVRVAARRPGPRLPVPHRVRRRDAAAGRGRGSTMQRAAAGGHRRRRLPRGARPGARRGRRVRPAARGRVARRRHVRRRPDLRPRGHHRGLRPAAAPPSAPSAGRSWCCRRAATPTTPSAPTSPPG